MSPCILHRAGHLRVERCHLTCYSGGLDHLSSPIVTVAASALPLACSAATSDAAVLAVAVTATGTSAAAAAADSSGSSHCTVLSAATECPVTARPVKQPRATPASASLTDRLSLGAGPGKLVVADTRLSGGGKGVRCLGTGALQGVRTIYGAGRMPLFFFEVDARLVPV